MKKLAKDKMLRALRDVNYTKNHYEQEIEQLALKNVVQSNMQETR